MATAAATPFRLFRFSVIGIAFFAFLAWILLLGGISAIQASNACDSPGLTEQGNVANLGKHCRYLTGLPWFIIWFQFILILPALAVEFLDRGAWRPTIMLLLAVNTVLAIIEADKYLNYKDANGSSSRINAVIAGFIILSIFNLLLILLSGSRTALEGRYGEDRDVGVATYPSKTRPTTPATAPSPQVTVPPPQSTYGTTAPSPV